VCEKFIFRSAIFSQPAVRGLKIKKDASSGSLWGQSLALLRPSPLNVIASANSTMTQELFDEFWYHFSPINKIIRTFPTSSTSVLEEMLRHHLSKADYLKVVLLDHRRLRLWHWLSNNAWLLYEWKCRWCHRFSKLRLNLEVLKREIRSFVIDKVIFCLFFFAFTLK